MSDATGEFQPIEVGAYWADLNEHLVALLDLIPEDRLDEAPEGEWGARAVASHIIGGRDHWLAHSLGREAGEPLPQDATVAGLQDALRASWERTASFLTDAAALEATYEPPPNDPTYVDPPDFTGHYIAFHRLVHDVHHRAQLLDRIRDLEIDVPEAIRRRPLY